MKLIDFLMSISEHNFGMFNLISMYFLNNHLETKNKEDKFKTLHSCINIDENDIIIYNNEKKDDIYHNCKCPFLRLLLSNWREEIISKENTYEQFIYSFVYNLPLKKAFCIIFYFIYRQNILNGNRDIMNNINQFLFEDALKILAEKTTLIENTYDIFYDFFSHGIELMNSNDNNGIVEKLKIYCNNLRFVSMHYTHPKIRKMMTQKTSMIKRIIDCFCLIHNEISFKSIVPHPIFQGKSYSKLFVDLEIKLLTIIKEINMFIEWDKYNQIKDIFYYLINKIINQKSERIKQLEKDEYSFHLGLYRCFGLLINYYCFNHSINNKCSIFESIQFFIKDLFNSQNNVEEFINIILNDYF